MKKLLSLLALAMLTLGAWAGEVTFDFSSQAGLTAMGITAPEQSKGVNLTSVGAITVDGVTLTAKNGSTETRVWNSQGSYTLRIYVDGSITFAVEKGSITGVTITAASTSNFDLLANVGNYTVADGVGTWSGSTRSVSFSHSTTKNAQIATVVVTTSDADPDDNPGKDPDIDPNITKLDSLINLPSLPDGTEFQFTTEAYVNYQWGNYLWLQQLDSEYWAWAALVYGDTGKQYQLGSVIPAGWTGKKTTYKGLIEITNPAHFANATSLVGEDYYSPFDMTGYVSYILDPEEGYENFKVSMNGITLSEIDDKGNFTITSREENEDGEMVDVILPGFNKFGIDYPTIEEGETYSIEGMVTIYNDAYQLYPISISGAPATRLWRINYSGEDGTRYTIADTLFVIQPTTSVPDGNLIFVTDNVTQILYDEYADWGMTWWEDWYPNWIALDCGNNTELYNTIAAMKVLAPETVKGVLADFSTNPRILLDRVPQELAGEEIPEIIYYYYNLSGGKVNALGNEIGLTRGWYKVIGGEPYLCSAQDTVRVKLDFRYAPALQQTLVPGTRYEMSAVFKVNDEWATDDQAAPAPARRKAFAVQRDRLKAPVRRAADWYAADYYTNYTICPLTAQVPTAISNVDTDATVASVKYYDTLGNESATPFSGVNIVVTTMTDGSRSVTKAVK